MKHERRVIELAAATAGALERVAAHAQLEHLNEVSHLQPAGWAVAVRLSKAWVPPAELSKPHAKDAGWPKLGPLDLALTWQGELPVLLELKCGAGAGALDACAWDAIKLAYLLGHGRGTSGYLLAGTRAEDWDLPVREVELFEKRDFDALELRERYAPSFKKWELDGYPVASLVPKRLATESVAVFPLHVGTAAWELRLARVVRLGSDWVEWPRLVVV